MFVIIPLRLVRPFLPLVLLFFLLNLVFVAGIVLSQAGVLLFTTRRASIAIEILAIPVAFLTSWLFFRLGSRLFKSPNDDEGGGLLSKVGFTAWLIFLMTLAALAAGGYFGTTGAIDWAHRPFQSKATERSPDQPATSGRIYFAPPVPAAPKPTTASSKT